MMLEKSSVFCQESSVGWTEMRQNMETDTAISTPTTYKQQLQQVVVVLEVPLSTYVKFSAFLIFRPFKYLLTCLD